MKKFFAISLVALAGILSFASCDPEEKTPAIPAVIETEFSNLAKVSVQTTDGISTIKVNASTDKAAVEFTFTSDKVYLGNGNYVEGTEKGNFTAHYKDELVDNDAVSGVLVVSSDVNDNYTIEGTIRLDNKEGTAVKIKATGKMEFELPAEYNYTVKKEGNNFVYDIYTLGPENVLLAKATVCGSETGEFTVAGTGEAGTAMYGRAAQSGCFITIGQDGYFMQLSGSVKITAKAGKLTFAFNGPQDRDAIYNNCEKVESVNVPSPTHPFVAYGVSIKYFGVESEIVPGAYEFTAKTFLPDGAEFITITALTSSLDFWRGEGQHQGWGFMTYGYNYYLAAGDAGLVGKLGIQPASYYILDNVPHEVPEGYFLVINDQSESGSVTIAAPIDDKYNGPADLMQWLLAADPENVSTAGIYVLMGFLAN